MAKYSEFMPAPKTKSLLESQKTKAKLIGTKIMALILTTKYIGANKRNKRKKLMTEIVLVL